LKEEDLVRFVFANQLLFCTLFGALGGLVNSLDINQDLTIRALIHKIIVSSSAGILLFFITYDIEKLSPALRVGSALITGFYGSDIFRKLASVYLNRATQIMSGGNNNVEKK